MVSHDRPVVNRMLYSVLGYLFLFLGLIGLVLPVLQGMLFLVAGLLLLARHNAWAQRLLRRLARTHPKAAEWIETAEAWLDRLMFRLEGWLRRIARRLRWAFGRS